MGDPKKRKKLFDKPKKPWEKERIEKERDLKTTYGLKNKKEIYRAQTEIRKKRATAKKLLALDLERRIKREKELLDSLVRMGILSGKPSLEDVLTLTEEVLLERRLQTIVLRKGLANTAKQARQFITHGHIAVNGKKVDKPSYIVTAVEEASVAYYKTPMEITPKKSEKAKPISEDSKKEMKQDFEEAKGIDEIKDVKETVVENEGEQ
jgi:small subunit ribosomal protein S4